MDEERNPTDPIDDLSVVYVSLCTDLEEAATQEEKDRAQKRLDQHLEFIQRAGFTLQDIKEYLETHKTDIAVDQIMYGAEEQRMGSCLHHRLYSALYEYLHALRLSKENPKEFKEMGGKEPDRELHQPILDHPETPLILDLPPHPDGTCLYTAQPNEENDWMGGDCPLNCPHWSPIPEELQPTFKTLEEQMRQRADQIRELLLSEGGDLFGLSGEEDDPADWWKKGNEPTDEN